MQHCLFLLSEVRMLIESCADFNIPREVMATLIQSAPTSQPYMLTNRPPQERE